MYLQNQTMLVPIKITINLIFQMGYLEIERGSS